MIGLRYVVRGGLAGTLCLAFGAAAHAGPRESLHDTPQPCAAVSAEDIRRAGSASVSDILGKLPSSPPPQERACPQPRTPFDRYLLDAHNGERAAVGAPPLRWNADLAGRAADYAQVLARIGQLVHAPREGRGNERENLQMSPAGSSAQRMIGAWLSEKADFVPGIFPNVARDGNWNNVSHYTQMIWPTTTDVGCGVAQGRGFNWLVCRYFPGGNKDGKPVGLARLDPATQSPGNAPEDRPEASGHLLGHFYGLPHVFDDGRTDPPDQPLHDYGSDGGIFVGYDLGAFRLEAEAAYKRADLDSFLTDILFPESFQGLSPVSEPPSFTPAEAPYSLPENTDPDALTDPM